MVLDLRSRWQGRRPFGPARSVGFSSSSHGSRLNSGCEGGGRSAAAGDQLEEAVTMTKTWAARLGVVLVATGVGAAMLAPTAQAGTTGASAKGATSAAKHPGSRCPLPVFGPGKSYHPKINRKSFTPEVTNPWFPLVVGRTMIYTGVKDGKRALNVVVITPHTKVIDGVRTRVIEDRLYLAGRARGTDPGLLRPGRLRKRLVLR